LIETDVNAKLQYFFILLIHLNFFFILNLLHPMSASIYYCRLQIATRCFQR